jgi:bidirectional [NiFe] hydrogenase diaphorase subunit
MAALDPNDKRYKLLDAAMRKHGYQANALIESLHTAQQSYGFLDNEVLRLISRKLKLPPSKVYGVATFYNLFTLKPQGEHTCVVCMGTACYIKGAPKLLDELQKKWHVRVGETTPNGRLSVLQARCFGSCAAAPVVSVDGTVLGGATPAALGERIKQWMDTSGAPDAVKVVEGRS